MKRSASAMWNGDLKAGKGTISTDSGVLSNTQYSFGTRFENGAGTNPEELIAAAHAGCFSMALSAQLGEAGLVAQSIRTKATVTLEKSGGGFAITGRASRSHRPHSRRQPAGVRDGRREREGRLPGIEGVERARSRWTRSSRRNVRERAVARGHPAPGGVLLSGRGVRRFRTASVMEPLAVLIVLPVVVGVAAERLFRDTSRASLAAAVVSSLSVYSCLRLLDPDGTWNWLATFLVPPLAIAFSLATVLTASAISRDGAMQARNDAPRAGLGSR